MNRNLAARIMDLLRRRQLKGTLAKIALMLSCMAIFMITYMLVAPVLTQEWEAICGMKEHTHTDACFEEVLGELICNKTEHRHTSACLDEAGNQICGLEEHLHTKECCILASAAPDKTDKQASPLAAPVLTRKSENACGLEEHTHTDVCWDEAGNLICGQEEHSHSDACLLEKPTTVPVKPEETNHKHTDECYKEVAGEIICGMEEHTHTDVCQDEMGNYICGMQEHTHADSCFAHHKELICGMEETEKQEPKKITILTCGLKEHTHTDQCYHKAEDNEQKYICGFLTEHTHGKDCYFENGELKCTLAEHIHDETCLPAQEGPIFPKTLPEGYKEAEIFQFDSAMLTEGENNEQELEALVYIPENAFDEEVMFVPEPLAEDDDRYTDAVAQLKQASAEYNSMTAMDLSFVNSDGEPLEPNTESGPVYVRLTMSMELSEEAKLTLWHHTTEEPAAEVIAKEVKADTAYQDGVLTVDFAADSFSTYTLTREGPEPPVTEQTAEIASWSTTNPAVEFTDENGIRIWNVSGTQYRYLQIPVRINVSGADAGAMTITLPYALEHLGRTVDGKEYTPTCDIDGIANKEGWQAEYNKEKNEVTITNSKKVDHGTLDIYYTFDCWNIPSDEVFTISCSVQKQKGAEAGKVDLKGKIHTWHNVEIKPYANDGVAGDSEYAFNGFGGADKQSAYIPKWNIVYKTYFGLTESDYDGDAYVYDIAPFLINPQGQQPYNISGTFTPDNNGELVGAVYMMDSREKPNALWMKVNAQKVETVTDKNQYEFTIDNESLKIDDDAGKRYAVVSDLSDTTDNKTYTLYFLVKYPKSGMADSIQLNADLSLTHTGIDSGELKTANGNVCLYKGAKEPGGRIYWASYVSDNVKSSAGLTTLNNDSPATVEYSADFFCLNEARSNHNRNDKYRLEAIIDLSYLTDSKTQLTENDYRFSGYRLSLVDAEGSWSQNWQGDLGPPNIGWTEDKFGTAPSWAANEMIEVYGSTSLTEDNWISLGSVSAASVWAKDKNRDFTNHQYKSIDDNYVRLKVVYNSRLTTALRVGYQMEVQPAILTNHNLTGITDLHLTNWFNYLAYTPNGQRDSAMSFNRYPVADEGWEAESDGKLIKGTIELVRQHDADYPYPGYPQPENWYSPTEYSFRNVAKATLSSNTDAAGMIVTQALYDEGGNLVGDPTSIDPNTNDSYSLKKDVVNASEVVYSITGVVTNGASSLGDLQERVNKADEGSPYKALKMRYYVLLPDGLMLNTNPDNGEVDEEGNPKYHFWSEGTTNYLSANSAFYNSNSAKVVQGGQTDVPVSDAKISGWKRLSANGNLSEMYWIAGGSVTHNTELSSGQLVVFERTLGNWCDYDRFNMWGTSETYFWGRGLSFSAVPTNGVGSLSERKYEAKFWCQFLDGDDNPISLSDFARNDVETLEGADSNTLLYIPIDFNNKSNATASQATLAVKITDEAVDENGNVIVDEDENPCVIPEGRYSYPLTYCLDDGSSKNVVLWCNIEQATRSEWQGTVTGVTVPDGATVYVQHEYASLSSGNLSITDLSGWKKVDDINNCDWNGVKAIAFSFGDKEFSKDQSVTATIHMQAPADEALMINGKPKEPGKTIYHTYNQATITDEHGTGEKGKWNTAYVSVPMKVSPVSYELPSTGGAGMSSMYVVGMALILAAAYLIYQTLRRNRKKGRGGSRLI